MSKELHTTNKLLYPNVNSLVYTENSKHLHKKIYHRVVKHLTDCDKCYNTRICTECDKNDDESSDESENESDNESENESDNENEDEDDNEELDDKNDKGKKKILKETIFCYACDNTTICEWCPGMKRGIKPILVCTLGCGFIKNYDPKECKRVSIVKLFNNPINIPQESFKHDEHKYNIMDRVHYTYYCNDTHMEKCISGTISKRFQINNIKLYTVDFFDMSLDLYEKSLEFVEKDLSLKRYEDKYPSQSELGCGIRNYNLLMNNVTNEKTNVMKNIERLEKEVLKQELELKEAETKYMRRQTILKKD